jgi:hypothetical protein
MFSLFRPSSGMRRSRPGTHCRPSRKFSSSSRADDFSVRRGERLKNLQVLGAALCQGSRMPFSMSGPVGGERLLELVLCQLERVLQLRNALKRRSKALGDRRRGWLGCTFLTHARQRTRMFVRLLGGALGRLIDLYGPTRL